MIDLSPTTFTLACPPALFQGGSSGAAVLCEEAQPPLGGVCTHRRLLPAAHPPRTELLQADVLHGVDAGQVGDTALDSCPRIPCGLVHALNHLLLAVDPVEVPAQHSQAHRLHDVGILQGQAVGPCKREALPLSGG